MTTPIILLVGQAGSGKDTAAQMIVKNYNAVSVAQADPMKRFLQHFFQFSEEQLWGPSEARNALDARFALKAFREQAFASLDSSEGYRWVAEVLPEQDSARHGRAFNALIMWAGELLEAAAQDEGLTPRKTLQTLGTEWGRNYGQKDMWVNYATRTALDLLGGGHSYHRTTGAVKDPLVTGYDYVVITDGRFRNELVRVKAIGGKVFHIKAPDVTGAEAERAGVQGHTSETEQRGLPQHWFDAVVVNDKRFGFDALEETVGEAMEMTFHQLGNLFEPTELLIERVAGAAILP
jgi:hypothetical protein